MKSLEAKFMDAVNSIAVVCRDIDWENPQVYALWVRQQLALVRHTTRFICLAAAKTPIEQRAAHNEWMHHLKGELNHDLVAENDLKNLGYSEADIPILWSTNVIKQNQYYWLQNHNPVALCGYSLLLEGLASQIAPSVIQQIEKKYDKNQYRFLTLHANVDQEHFADGLKFIASLDSESRLLIEENLNQTLPLYTALLRELQSEASKGLKQSA